MSGSSIYLDYAAATPLDQRVLSVMEPYLHEEFYNPSALYQSARTVRYAYEDARHRLAMAIGAKQHEVIITAGATESIHIAVQGVIGHYGGSIAISRSEHAAVIGAASAHPTSWIEVDQRGYASVEAVKNAITDDTTLVSVAYISNELGTVQPLRAIARLIEDIREIRRATGNTTPIFFHTDASQAPGLLDISVSRLGVDMMTLNSSKCYGPKQVGLLWVRAGVEVMPFIRGGGQENGIRSGTENVAGAVGFAEALTRAVKHRAHESHRLAVLRSKLEQIITSSIGDVVVNGHPKQRAPHILHISVPGLDGERAVFGLDERGVMAATGSACAANNGTRSHVLTAIGMSDELADGSLRFSLGRSTTEDEITRAGAIITEVVAEERTR